MPSVPLPSLIPHLNRLPRELVHQILDHLPLARVLKLLLRNDDYVSSCIRTHLYYQVLFPLSSSSPSPSPSPSSPTPAHDNDDDAIAAVKAAFVLWSDIALRNERNRRHLTPASLETYYVCISRSSLPSPASLIRDIQASITQGLMFKESQLAIVDTLSRTSRSPGPPAPLDDAGTRWRWMTASQQALSDVKSAQLYRLADLLFAYPGMLKERGDPGVGARTSPCHVVRQLQREGLRVQKDWIWQRQFSSLGSARDVPTRGWNRGRKPGPVKCHVRLHAGYFFDSEELPLVPIKKYPEFFQHTLRENPPLLDTDTDTGTTRESEELAHLVKTCRWMRPRADQTRPPIPHAYPAPITHDLHTVLVGLRDGHQKRAPHFYSLGQAASRSQQRPPIQLEWRLFAHDERQMEWLEAFCRCCAWMEGRFGGMKG